LTDVDDFGRRFANHVDAEEFLTLRTIEL
jgi:hypothetical protein